MSLDEEFKAAMPKRSSTESWVQEFYESLSAKDKKTWDTAVLSHDVSGAAVFRVMKAHGYPGGLTSARDWVRKCREENESSR